MWRLRADLERKDRQKEGGREGRWVGLKDMDLHQTVCIPCGPPHLEEGWVCCRTVISFIDWLCTFLGGDGD